MTNDEIFSKVKEVILESKPELEGKIDMESTFREGLGMDSLDMISLLFELEEVFEVKIPEEDVSSKNLVSVTAIVSYINDKI